MLTILIKSSRFLLISLQNTIGSENQGIWPQMKAGKRTAHSHWLSGSIYRFLNVCLWEVRCSQNLLSRHILHRATLEARTRHFFTHGWCSAGLPNGLWLKISVPPPVVVWQQGKNRVLMPLLLFTDSFQPGPEEFYFLTAPWIPSAGVCVHLLGNPLGSFSLTAMPAHIQVSFNLQLPFMGNLKPERLRILARLAPPQYI